MHNDWSIQTRTNRTNLHNMCNKHAKIHARMHTSILSRFRWNRSHRYDTPGMCVPTAHAGDEIVGPRSDSDPATICSVRNLSSSIVQLVHANGSVQGESQLTGATAGTGVCPWVTFVTPAGHVRSRPDPALRVVWSVDPALRVRSGHQLYI